MDVGNKEKLEGEKKAQDSVNYHTPQLQSDCRFGGRNYVNSSMGMVTNSNPMADSCSAVVWDHHANSQPYSSLNQIGLAGAVSGSWQEPNSVTKGGFFVSANIPHLSQIPADSAFIERAARFSCFNSGNITDLMNSFPMNQPVSPYHQLSSMPHGPLEGIVGGEKPQKNDTNPPSTSKGECSPCFKNARHNDETKRTESDEAESVGGRGQDENSLMDTTTESCLPKGVGAKKRRSGGQDTELEPDLSRQLSGEDANKDPKHFSPPTKTTGKKAKSSSQAYDSQKEDYIHVRARRGQATNSHSLAERIRREKISERMKYLQDLVPGCSKVTGKAVMLDEIINYVQSLQRQVEFLSMKLATVDPRVDFNIDSLLAKEQLFPTLAGPSSSLGFSPDVPMAYPSMHPCPPPGIHPVIGGHSSDALRNLNPHLTSMNQGYKESTQQMPNAWDYDLQNVVQMGFDHSNPVENQEPKSPLPPTSTKPES
ncbi:hypothetical protein V2J09_012911 [Rumex salicifolius]